MTEDNFLQTQKLRLLKRIEYSEAVIRSGGPRAMLKDRVLPNLKRALAKIHTSQYLKCDDCGEAIDNKRLEKIPGAIRCSDCQEQFEAKT